MHYQTVGYLERGEYSPSLELALRIADGFGWAWIVLGETLGPLELVGLVVAVVGVALGTRRSAPRLEA